MFLQTAGSVLMGAGLLVSVVFWIPRVVDRTMLREILGRRYPLVYLVYTANGPGLFVLGLLLVLKGAAVG